MCFMCFIWLFLLFFHVGGCLIGLCSYIENIKLCCCLISGRVSLPNLILLLRVKIIRVGLIVGVLWSWRRHIIWLGSCFGILGGWFCSYFWLILWFIANCWCPEIELIKSITSINIGCIIWGWFFFWRWCSFGLCFNWTIIFFW